MAIDCNSVPRHLKVMRAITGTEETSGSGNNPRIMGMRDWIACTYPEMMEYCEGYTGDDVAWCGLTAAFCCTIAGVRPPFDPRDELKCFLWAKSFSTDPGFDELDDPVLGTIVVMDREGGGHVTMFEGWVDEGDTFKARGGNQSDAINVQTYSVDQVVGWFWPDGVPMPSPGPIPEPDGEHETVQKGDTGPDVAEVQRILGLPSADCDGDFGSITEGAVKGFQRAVGLEADGVVGSKTWVELDALEASKTEGAEGLPPELVNAIVKIAESSAIASYNWDDRGQAPRGWISGVAVCFAFAMTLLNDEDDSVARMARAEENDDEDCLHWYRSQYKSLGMDNSEDGIDTLRHLFALILGLGMCESSGRYCEGRDTSASNTSADSAEAGCLQTSWDIRGCDNEIPPLLSVWMDNPNGFLTTFQRGVSPDSNDLDNYGSGQDGTKYQFLSKFAPCFHVFVTAIGMRSLGGESGHWGPLRRYEAELKSDADDMLMEVQELTAGRLIA